VLDLCDVVFEDCRYVSLERRSVSFNTRRSVASACTYLWEDALAVADQETSLATSTIADHHKLLAVLRWRRDVCARAARGSRVYCAIRSSGASSVVAVCARCCKRSGAGTVFAADVVVVLDGLHRHDGWRDRGLCDRMRGW
jgi:cytochrome c553